jgi:hypothetical protein
MDAITFVTMSAVASAVGEALALGVALALAETLAAAEAPAVAVVVAVEVRVALGGGTVPPKAGMKPAPPVGDGAGMAGSSEHATTSVASMADRIVRTPTERGC